MGVNCSCHCQDALAPDDGTHYDRTMVLVDTQEAVVNLNRCPDDGGSPGAAPAGGSPGAAPSRALRRKTVAEPGYYGARAFGGERLGREGGMETYGITLERGASRLGFDVNIGQLEWQKTLPIKSINGGIAAQWNADHPELEIRTGDHILEVNGIRGNADQMLVACRRQGQVRLVVGRPEGEIEWDVTDAVCDSDACCPQPGCYDPQVDSPLVLLSPESMRSGRRLYVI
mmetsp:Transcript_109849/g.310821  ORF Transcript_109849/g.310821 Transcript_109849/m.310821 type:complete len:229 (-) Transcript_109849:22-708(-)